MHSNVIGIKSAKRIDHRLREVICIARRISRTANGAAIHAFFPEKPRNEIRFCTQTNETTLICESVSDLLRVSVFIIMVPIS